MTDTTKWILIVEAVVICAIVIPCAAYLLWIWKQDRKENKR